MHSMSSGCRIETHFYYDADLTEQAVEDAYSRGDIDLKERNRQLRELQRDYVAAAQEAAQGAYDREMERW